jgi:plasmid stabilization system protein ParE
MNYKVDLSLKARNELFEAWKWYEEQRLGLGEQFEQEFFKKADLIQNNPLHYKARGKYREAQTDIFPFLIVFRFDRKTGIIIIVSIFHTSRHPKKKYK